MPSFVIKVDPSRDEYVYWSTVVEAPAFWGNRAETLAMLTEGADSWLKEEAPHHPENRMRRADEFGTSCIEGWGEEGRRFYDWAYDSLIYQQQGLVNRDDLWALCKRIDRDEDVADLLRHFDDCECDACATDGPADA